MADLYDIVNGANDMASRFQTPPGLASAMRIIEEQERATKWLRESETARYATRLHEEAATIQRVQEMSAGLHLEKLGLYQTGIESAERLLGSSIGMVVALEAEAERQRRLYLEPMSAIHRATLEQMRQVEQFTAHARSMQEIADSTLRLNGMLQATMIESRAIDAAMGINRMFMPYNALERACSSVLDAVASASVGLDDYSSILTFAPFVLPNVAATAILASTNPKDLTQGEIDEALESLSELIDVDEPTLALQLAAVHPKLVSCLQTARDAAAFNTPERLSLVFGQLRRTMDFALKELAPEADVRAWITNPKLQASADGQPTKLACITYIFRKLYCSKSFARMVFTDCVLFNRLYSQLSVECHTGTAEFDEVVAQLHITRVEALLYLISCAHVGSIGGSSDEE